MKSVLLNRHNLEIAKLAAKEESRYTPNAIRVTEKETVATDGHLLVRVTNPQACQVDHFPIVPGDAETVETESLLMPRDAALETLKVLPKKSTIAALTHAKVGKDAAGAIRATVTDLKTHRPLAFREVQGQYPNIDAVMPQKAPKLRIGVSAKLLGQLLAIAATYTERSTFVELSFWGNQTAMRIDARDDVTGQNFVGILMPMRGEVKNRPFPEQPAETEAAAAAEAQEEA